MKKLLFLSFVLCTIFITSCSKDDEKASPFQGSWSGTYTGPDTGTWTANINAEGVIAGSVDSDLLNFPLPLQGVVNDQGEFTSTVGTAQLGLTFTGQLTSNTGQGTWESTDASSSGTWTGTKQ